MTKILFVCHGNICRSPMAEFVMKDLVRKAGLEDKIFVDSKACRRDELGNDTYYGTKEILRKKGIPFSKRRATQITAEDYKNFDYIIGMDFENMRDFKRIFGEDSQEKIYLLMNFAGENREVADPWYTDDFETTYNDVLKGCRALLNFLPVEKN